MNAPLHTGLGVTPEQSEHQVEKSETVGTTTHATVLPGGSNTNDPRVFGLGRECLELGIIMEVRNRDEARRAQALGAVGVVCRPPAEQRTPDRFRDILDAISILPTCLSEDLSLFLAGYRKRYGEGGPGFFVLSEMSEGRDQCEECVLAYVDSVEEIPQLRSSLVFVRCRSLGQAQQALRLGAGGGILRFIPDEHEIRRLNQWPAEVSQGWTKGPGKVIGIAAFQGDFRFQKDLFERALAGFDTGETPVRIVLLRNTAEFAEADAICIPGGWSNCVSRILRQHGLDETLRTAHARGVPILGICCGMILARSRDGFGCEDRIALGLVDIGVHNNAVSGEFTVELAGRRTGPIRMVNAPIVAGEIGPLVEVLARLDTPAREIVGVRQGSAMAFSFHEGVQDLFLHHCMACWLLH